MGSLLATVLNLFALLGVAVAFLTTWVVAEAVIYQGLFRPGLERDLGFQEGTAILPGSGLRGYTSAVSIGRVTEDGVFARAGLNAGDVLPDETHSSLFKKLHRHRGRAAELSVVEGGAGPPSPERPRRLIQINVPRRGLQN